MTTLTLIVAKQAFRKDHPSVDKWVRAQEKLTGLDFVEIKHRLRLICKRHEVGSIAELINKVSAEQGGEWSKPIMDEVSTVGTEIPTADSESSGESSEQPISSKRVSKRTTLRDSLWPEAFALIWHRKAHQGFSTIPKELPLIMNVADFLAGPRMDVSKVYLSLWCNVWDNGFVEVTNPDQMAFEAGYTSKKRGTEWRKRINALKEMGFIDTKPGAAGDYAYILLIDPMMAIEKLLKAHQDKVPEAMVNALKAKSITFGK